MYKEIRLLVTSWLISKSLCCSSCLLVWGVHTDVFSLLLYTYVFYMNGVKRLLRLKLKPSSKEDLAHQWRWVHGWVSEGWCHHVVMAGIAGKQFKSCYIMTVVIKLHICCVFKLGYWVGQYYNISMQYCQEFMITVNILEWTKLGMFSLSCVSFSMKDTSSPLKKAYIKVLYLSAVLRYLYFTGRFPSDGFYTLTFPREIFVLLSSRLQNQGCICSTVPSGTPSSCHQ